MLELVLIRHGETAGNLQPTALGLTDLPLTERGKRQASSLARVFALERPEAIYTSPLTRAVETAEIIARQHQMQVEPLLDLEERHFGIWENLPVAEIRRQYPDEYLAWEEDLVDYVIPQGESARENYNRCARLVDELIKRHPEGRILLVTHLGCIRNIIAHLLGMDVQGAWCFQVNTGCICRLRIDEKAYAVLTALNEF